LPADPRLSLKCQLVFRPQSKTTRIDIALFLLAIVVVAPRSSNARESVGERYAERLSYSVDHRECRISF